MTTQSTTVFGERRYYIYEPMMLDPAAVWQSLSPCKVAAAQALHDIRVTWDREQSDTLILAFANPQSEGFEARFTVSGADFTAFNPKKRASVARYMRSRPTWKIKRSMERVSDRCAITDADVFATMDGNLVSVGDLWTALQALHAAVCGHSDRVRTIYDPQDALFRNDEDDTVVEPVSAPPTQIAAERRILAYEEQPLPLNALDATTWREQQARAHMTDIHITWQEYGSAGTLITFVAPDGRAYEAEVMRNVAGDTSTGDCWDVEIYTLNTGRQVKRAAVYYESPDGAVIFDDVMGVLALLHDDMVQREAQGYFLLNERSA